MEGLNDKIQIEFYLCAEKSLLDHQIRFRHKEPLLRYRAGGIKNGSRLLTKKGYGSMAITSFDQQEYLTGSAESALDEADIQAVTTDLRFTHDEVFDSIRREIEGRSES